MIPYAQITPKYKSEVNVFEGFDSRARISESRFADLLNFTTDKYPFMSTRPSRGSLSFDASGDHTIIAMDGGGDELVIVMEYIVIEDSTEDSKPALLLRYGSITKIINEDKFYGEKRHLVRMGKNYILFPDQIAFHVEGEEIVAEKIYDEHVTKDFSFIMGEIVDGAFVPSTFERGYTVIDYSAQTGVGVFLGEEDRTASQVIKISDPIIELFDTDNTATDLSAYISAKIISSPWIYRDGKQYCDLNTIRRVEGDIVFDGAMLCYKLTCADGDQIVEQRYNASTGQVYEETYTAPGEMSITYTELLKPPLMDFVVECQNRLWGCRCGTTRNGEQVNELYASALGDYNVWHRFDGIADDSWVASVGTPGKFTGATVVAGIPIFFKENSIHKIYISTAGAHQVIQLDSYGVSDGNGRSVTKVGELIYFKGRHHVYAFDGTNSEIISDPLGTDKLTDTVGGVFKDKYVLYSTTPDGCYRLYVFDTRKGLWTKESISNAVECMTAYRGNLLLAQGIVALEYEASSSDKQFESNIPYIFETGDIGYESTEGRYLCRLDLRITLDFSAHFNLWIQYDNSGEWISLARLIGEQTTPTVQTVHVLPYRCELFRLRCTGLGGMTLHNIKKIYEICED